MDDQTIQSLRDYCSKFAAYRDLTTDGDGNNLHDIKSSFDYIAKYVEQNQLGDTVFGGNVASKATEAGKILSQLWTCFDNIEKSITSFCDNQEANNNSGQ